VQVVEVIQKKSRRVGKYASGRFGEKVGEMTYEQKVGYEISNCDRK